MSKGNDINVDSIEEDIKIVKELLKGAKDYGQYNGNKYFYSIENILQEYTRQKQINEEHQKINGELRVKAQKLEKENEKLKITINKQSIDISNNLLKLQQKDKQIDLMAIRILVKIIGDYPCGYKQDCIKSDKEYRDIHCKDCIKQYFETKAKGE